MTLKEKLAAAQKRLQLEQERDIYLEAVKSGSKFADFYQGKADSIQEELEQ